MLRKLVLTIIVTMFVASYADAQTNPLWHEEKEAIHESVADFEHVIRL